jgi:hypothetical protein
MRIRKLPLDGNPEALATSTVVVESSMSPLRVVAATFAKASVTDDS